MLVGHKIILRTLRQADMNQLYDLAADVRDMGDYWPLSLPSEIRWQKRLSENGWWEEDSGGLLITEHDGNIVGHVFFFKPSAIQNSYELGYRIYKPEHWGKGYMTEAVSLTIAYLFATKPVDRVQATTLPGNTGSQEVLKRCGFQFEGVMRKAIFHQGRSQDLHLFSVLRDECAPLKEQLAAEESDGP